MKLQFLRETRGNALVETALFLPMLTTLLLGALNFGFLLNQYLRVVDSASSAAEAATTRVYANNLAYVQLVGNLSSNNLPGYAVTAIQYCLCAPGTAQISCSTHTSCGTYGIPNQYVQVTATAQLPMLFAMKGFPAKYNVKSVAIARTAWTGTQ